MSILDELHLTFKLERSSLFDRALHKTVIFWRMENLSETFEQKYPILQKGAPISSNVQKIFFSFKVLPLSKWSVSSNMHQKSVYLLQNIELYLLGFQPLFLGIQGISKLTLGSVNLSLWLSSLYNRTHGSEL